MHELQVTSIHCAYVVRISSKQFVTILSIGRHLNRIGTNYVILFDLWLDDSKHI